MNKYEQKVKQLTDKWKDYVSPTLNPLSEAELQELERQLGRSLPADYREFLCAYDGIWLDSGVKIPKPKPEGPIYAAVEFFYGVDPSNYWTDLFTRFQSKSAEWGTELLPIGEAEKGYLCMVIAGQEEGTIYFYNCGDERADLPLHRVLIR